MSEHSVTTIKHWVLDHLEANLPKGFSVEKDILFDTMITLLIVNIENGLYEGGLEFSGDRKGAQCWLLKKKEPDFMYEKFTPIEDKGSVIAAIDEVLAIISDK